MRTLGASDHVVVVGAGLAGWRYIEALRQQGFSGALTLIGDEHYQPYDRPPLSKQVLTGKWDVDRTALANDTLIAKNDVQMQLGVAASGIDLEACDVMLANGSVVHATHIVIATGTRARRLESSARADILTIRTRDDLNRMQVVLSALEPGSVVAVIGGGFVGAEAATALHARGFVPVVLEAAERPLVNVLGPQVSSWLSGLAASAGIELRSAQQITDVVNRGNEFAVLFDTGLELGASAVLESVGASPNVEWLATSGLVIDNGVLVDENLMASERVGAIGDVARFAWEGPNGVEMVRIEHWQVAVDHAAHLAHYMMVGVGASATNDPVFLVRPIWQENSSSRTSASA